jgi:hypothetical protein
MLTAYPLQNYVAIPKSVSKTRIASNTNIFDFELEPQEVLELDGLDEGENLLVADVSPLINIPQPSSLTGTLRSVPDHAPAPIDVSSTCVPSHLNKT